MKLIIGIVLFITTGFSLIGQINENENYIDSVSAKIIGLKLRFARAKWNFGNTAYLIIHCL
jgi:hypothetical protein